MVGVINTLVGTGLMFILYNVFSVNYWISSASNYIVGSIVSYFLNKYFTFKNKERCWQHLISNIPSYFVLKKHRKYFPPPSEIVLQEQISSLWLYIVS